MNTATETVSKIVSEICARTETDAPAIVDAKTAHAAADALAWPTSALVPEHVHLAQRAARTLGQGDEAAALDYATRATAALLVYRETANAS